METGIERVTDRARVFDGVDVWNRQHPDFRISDPLVRQNVFAPFDGVTVECYGGFAGGDLVAFAVVKRLARPVDEFGSTDEAWLSLFAFDRRSGRGTSLGRAVLGRVLEEVASAGASELHFGCSPQSFLPGIPPDVPQEYADVLEDAGFVVDGVVHDLARDISEFRVPEPVRRTDREWPDLTLVSASGRESELQSFLADQFPGRWHYEARNVVRVPGGAADYWLLRNGDETVGFARSNRHDGAYLGPNVNWGRRLAEQHCGIGPLGVHEAYRGRGWGLSMISRVVDRLRRDGYEAAAIDWTAIPEYYEKLGFERWIAYESAVLDL